jgi:hypothetical protein
VKTLLGRHPVVPSANHEGLLMNSAVGLLFYGHYACMLVVPSALLWRSKIEDIRAADRDTLA